MQIIISHVMFLVLNIRWPSLAHILKYNYFSKLSRLWDFSKNLSLKSCLKMLFYNGLFDPCSRVVPVIHVFHVDHVVHVVRFMLSKCCFMLSQVVYVFHLVQVLFYVVLSGSCGPCGPCSPCVPCGSCGPCCSCTGRTARSCWPGRNSSRSSHSGARKRRSPYQVLYCTVHCKQ